ncbi:uncharacterized protein LTR77_005302 [Saxophila tyrrhenica]|uniref:Amidohydrolase-related domain-containing protein n=1 Tax=Saxophila tyrrhenica TaxID=1690608 RepID=A0AAV9PB84_9PEZI|nr:hypothetical protein LTR77_005302 [Saxophila tyrrhenica]
MAATFKVDVHTHPIPGMYRQALLDAGYGPPGTNASEIFVDGFRTPEFTIESYLEERLNRGYNYSILSITAPGLSFLKGNIQAKTLARQLNDQMSTWTQEHPKQLGAFGVLPLPDIEASLAEIEYCLDELHMEGIGLYTNVNGVYLGDPALDPIMEELDRRKTTVFVHPAGPPAAPALYNMSLPVMEYPFDTTRAIGNLLFTGTRKRFPHMSMIFSHGGGVTPFLAVRLAIQSTLSFQGGKSYDEAYAELQGYYFDTAVTVGNASSAALKEFVGADRMLTGSDYPYMPDSLIPMAQQSLEAFEGFSAEDRRKIGWKNAFRLFPGLKTKFPEVAADV